MLPKDAVVVITGASKGLGKSLAYAFAKEGANLVLAARSTQQLTNICQELNKNYSDFNKVYLKNICDVSDYNMMLNLKNLAVSVLGKIDVWINNAGQGSLKPIDQTNINDARKIVNTNFWGTVNGTKAALEQMYLQKSGDIVNIISTSGFTPRANESIYCASKFAVAGFTDSVKLEAKLNGVRVIPVYPGGMQTEFFDNEGSERVGMNTSHLMNPNDIAKIIVETVKLPNSILPDVRLYRN